jgi:hypothetical protein
MSITQIRVLVAFSIVVAALAAFLVYRGCVERHESLLLGVEFAAGTPRTQVVVTLGKPDQKLVGVELRKYSAPDSPACLKAATECLRYFSPSEDGGPYCEVYLDAEERVVCVQHGLIAI